MCFSFMLTNNQYKVYTPTLNKTNCFSCFFLFFLKKAKETDKHTPMNRYGSKKSFKDDTYSQAILLARKMYMLDGFTKNEIGQKLADR